MNKNIFIFDQNKCVGCHACLVACINENGFQTPETWRNIYHSNNSHFPQLPVFYLSLACNHCDDAPCLKSCPAQAYSRDEKTGAVIHHPEKCIGCKYCTWACPFDAPKYNPKTGIIEKCTFCNSRIEEGLDPACVNSCPVGALNFANIDFTREESKDSSPVPVDVGSNIKITKQRNLSGPEMDLNLFTNQTNNFNPKKKLKKISARKEWPLIFFTLLSVTLVSIYASETLLFSNYSKLTYIGFAIIAAVLSMLHLGRKTRAWRSILNIKNSWLSREIALFGLFFILVFFDFYIFDLPNRLVSSIGFLFLFSIDMIYKLATWQWPLKIHSAQTILIGITLFAIFSNLFYVFVFIVSFRITIYLYRKHQIAHSNWIISTLRVTVLTISAVLFCCSQNHTVILFLIALGELIDRIEFYNELNVPNPIDDLSL